MFTSPGEIFLNLGTLNIYYYGVFMALAMTVGMFVSNLIRAKFYPEISEKDFLDIVLIVIISGIIGARLYYCILNLPYYIENPLEILFTRQGGMSIHGGIILALVCGILYAMKKKLPVLKLADIIAYGLVLAQAIGRWGNFFNSEAFGLPTNIFCKLFIPISKRPLEYMNYQYFHPTFLYESILDVLIFIILYFVLKKLVKNVDGIIFCAYLILYSVARILVESLRIDSVLNIYGIPFPTIASLIIILLATIAMITIYRKTKN